MKKTKGFITIATGNEEYYKLAYNLLKSYRYFCKERLPFAILADRENGFTKEFDDVIIYKNAATNSYLDKLSLAEYLPYDENIFIDSDCLAYGDLNNIFTYFKDADDFSCFGRVLPIDDKTGWFEYENLGDYQNQVFYVVGLHGGIYYMRRGEVCNNVFDTAKMLIPEYSKFKFKGKFDTPGDEPLVALSMALNNCKPVQFSFQAICCYWEFTDAMNIDISKGCAEIVNKNIKTDLLHWGTRYTRQLVYKKEIDTLNLMLQNKTELIKKCRHKYDNKIRCDKYKKLVKRIINKIKRIVGIK